MLACTILFGLGACKHPPSSDCLSPHAPTGPVKDIVVFGDSLSDTSNFFTIVNHTFPLVDLRLESPPASHQGRAFSDQCLPLEYVARHYKIALEPAWFVANEKGRRQISTYKPQDDSNIIFEALIAPPHPIKKQKTEDRQLIKEHLEILKANMPLFGAKATKNNYAVVNTTLRSDYSGFINEWFNTFAVDKQIALFKQNAVRTDLESTVFIIMAGGNDLMNILTDSEISSSEDINELNKVTVALESYIQELLDFGARHILVIGPPDIGFIPIFYGSNYQESAHKLSTLLEGMIGKRIQDTFKQSEVGWLPIQEPIKEILSKWPLPIRYQAALSDIANRSFSIPHFIATGGELKVKYINNSSLSKIKADEYPFFDYVHGTHATYQPLADYIIEAIDELVAR